MWRAQTPKAHLAPPAGQAGPHKVLFIIRSLRLSTAQAWQHLWPRFQYQITHPGGDIGPPQHLASRLTSILVEDEVRSATINNNVNLRQKRIRELRWSHQSTNSIPGLFPHSPSATQGRSLPLLSFWVTPTCRGCGRQSNLQNKRLRHPQSSHFALVARTSRCPIRKVGQIVDTRHPWALCCDRSRTHETQQVAPSW